MSGVRAGGVRHRGDYAQYRRYFQERKYRERRSYPDRDRASLCFFGKRRVECLYVFTLTASSWSVIALTMTSGAALKKTLLPMVTVGPRSQFSVQNVASTCTR